jgi:predicted DNA binding protein
MNTTETFTVVEGNCTTGETIVREMTPEEITQLLKDREESKIARAKIEAEEQALADLKASAKAKLVAGNPLTEEEASVLVI